jgi:hypothetical protein
MKRSTPSKSASVASQKSSEQVVQPEDMETTSRPGSSRTKGM